MSIELVLFRLHDKHFIELALLCVFRSPSGRTALHEASSKGKNDYVMELYNNGADVKTRDSDGNSALHVSEFACHTRLKGVVLLWSLGKFFSF